MARGNNEIKISENNNLYVTHTIMLSDHAVRHCNSPVCALTGGKNRPANNFADKK